MANAFAFTKKIEEMCKNKVLRYQDLYDDMSVQEAIDYEMERLAEKLIESVAPRDFLEK